MYQTILIPTDGSDTADAVARHGIQLADQLGASVHALHVVESRLTGLPSDSMRQAEQVDEMRARGEEYVASVAEHAAAVGVPCTTAIATGKAYEEIVEYANENGIDAIVMGTRGRSGIEEFLLGNVTEKVIRVATVPVITIRKSKLE